MDDKNKIITKKSNSPAEGGYHLYICKDPHKIRTTVWRTNCVKVSLHLKGNR